jgi:hypothetical protein
MPKIKKNEMNNRLREARIAAEFATATDAIEYCGWRGSTYRAHENGQNNFNVEYATLYAKAYGVSAAWLLIGEENNGELKKKEKNKKIIDMGHKHDCVEIIYATALLLREDKENLSLLLKIKKCAEVQISKLN